MKKFLRPNHFHVKMEYWYCKHCGEDRELNTYPCIPAPPDPNQRMYPHPKYDVLIGKTIDGKDILIHRVCGTELTLKPLYGRQP